MSLTVFSRRVPLAIATVGVAAMLTTACGPTSSSTAAPATNSSSPGNSGSGGAVTAPSSTAATTGGGPGGSPSGSDSNAGSDTARSDCTSDDLKITLGSSDGAAGSLYMPIIFTNTSGGKCSIEGYPGVSLANSSGVIGNPATRDSSQSPSMITLAPGSTATAQLRVGDADDYSSSDCQRDTATFLHVYPPNSTQAVDVPYKGSGCQSKSVGLLQVQPLVAGSGS